MDRIIEFARSTLLSMEAFGVLQTKLSLAMTGKDEGRKDIFAVAIKDLRTTPKSRNNTSRRFGNQYRVEQLYRDGMSRYFRQRTHECSAYREVYIISDASPIRRLGVILQQDLVRLT
jgi:hypothetical protein